MPLRFALTPDPMDLDLLGQIVSLSAALLRAVAVVLFKRCGDTVPPMTLNLFKNTLALAVFVGRARLIDNVRMRVPKEAPRRRRTRAA